MPNRITHQSNSKTKIMTFWESLWEISKDSCNKVKMWCNKARIMSNRNRHPLKDKLRMPNRAPITTRICSAWCSIVKEWTQTVFSWTKCNKTIISTMEDPHKTIIIIKNKLFCKIYSQTWTRSPCSSSSSSLTWITKANKPSLAHNLALEPAARVPFKMLLLNILQAIISIEIIFLWITITVLGAAIIKIILPSKTTTTIWVTKIFLASLIIIAILRSRSLYRNFFRATHEYWGQTMNLVSLSLFLNHFK